MNLAVYYRTQVGTVRLKLRKIQPRLINAASVTVFGFTELRFNTPSWIRKNNKHLEEAR